MPAGAPPWFRSRPSAGSVRGPPQSPFVLDEERSAIYCASLVDYLTRRLSKVGYGGGIRNWAPARC